MAMLILGLAVFLGLHLVPAFPDLRAKIWAQMGERAYKGLFSLASLASLALIIWGYGLAREAPIAVWQPPLWTQHLAALLMLPVFPLLVAANYKPGRIKTVLKHPMLVAIKLWALAHLLANGTLADIVLFGSFLAYAVFDRISVKKRERAGLLTIAQGPASNDIVPVVAGLLIYLIFVFWLHEWLIGVAPMVRGG